mmetsp:Transcript_11217/g.39790  ORF Transcript_11217/g.39790 Transcript_11217/m.39790 type:complete len:97 (-) Transcript_11217:38-328(-)
MMSFAPLMSAFLPTAFEHLSSWSTAATIIVKCGNIHSCSGAACRHTAMRLILLFLSTGCTDVQAVTTVSSRFYACSENARGVRVLAYSSCSFCCVR